MVEHLICNQGAAGSIPAAGTIPRPLLSWIAEEVPFERRMQIAELEYISGPKAARAATAENNVGLPL